MLEKLHLFPEQASTVAERVDHLFYYLSAVTVIFVILIAGLIINFMVRYRRHADDEHGTVVPSSAALEILWTAVPFGIALIAFFWGASIYAALHRPPDDALEIHVVGKQWMWKLQHLEGQREINTLHVPVNRPVKLMMTSEDVIHSFYVPAFRIKQDVLPGRYTTTWFEATKIGTYHLFCTEYCGTLHSGMIGKVIVMEQAEFQAWLGGTGGTAGVSVATAGERLFAAQGCTSCHRADSTARGPLLAGVFGTDRPLTTGDTVVADERYLRESILNPRAKIVANYEPIMPLYEGLLSEEQVLELITYIKSLGAADTQG